jgi:hypothetical protein
VVPPPPPSQPSHPAPSSVGTLVAALPSDGVVHVHEEKTRIGVPAYDPHARVTVEPPLPVAPQKRADPAIHSSQAVRVIVWRAADGVHVAPQGTHVAAITVDAVLVALDPSADLTAWLTGK